MGNFLNYFKAALIVQLFWSIAVTLLVLSMPSSDLVYLSFASESPTASTIDSVGDQMQGALSSSSTLPVVDSATLVFYSGNIVLDLIGNFVTAIPQMFTLLLKALFSLFPIDIMLQKRLYVVSYAFISILYLFS